jgi:serine/threonine protein kinase/tetratricopeptide (TPR) repeat protein
MGVLNTVKLRPAPTTLRKAASKMRTRVEELFHEVADLPVEARAGYFAAHEADTTTRREVEALVGFDASPSTALEREIGQVAQRALARWEPNEMRCGAYRLGDMLGRGGMGAVYWAERADGEVTQRVAVKLLQPGMDCPRWRQLFLVERQILAGLSHPNIARLLDAGHQEDGQPFLVMEFVQGKAIDTYTVGRTIRDKVRLYLKVCAAVGYLHRNLVVHRDLKPPNILVTDDGEPKLLDFGIAKMMDVTADSTLTSMRMLTPDYASPEQVNGGFVTTATDIYSLGAVLYRLLTGACPYQFEGDSAGAISHAKITPPSKLVPDLKGDLEVILLKALRRESQERYTTVERFSEDLENYLESRPIHARQGDTWYRTRKFLRRRWLPVTAASLAVTGLSGGVLVADHQRAIAQQRFVQVRQLTERFIELHDDVANLPGSTKIREKMVTTALDSLHNLSPSSNNDAKLLSEIGQVYDKVAQAQGAPDQPNLGRAEVALWNFRKAVEFESRAAALNPAYRIDLASFRTELSYLAMLNGYFPEARQNLHAAAELLHQIRTENPEDVESLVLATRVAGIRGDLSELAGNYHDELAFFQEAAKLHDEYLCRKPSNAARVRAYRATTLVAWALADNKRYEEALATLHERAPIIDALLAAEPENLNYLRQKMAAANYEGQIYDNETGNCLGKPLEAVAALRHYVEIARKLATADPNNAAARLSLASAYYKLSWPLGKIDPRQSVRVAEDAVQLFDEDLARNPHDRVIRSGRARALRHLAYAYGRNHNRNKARAAIEQAIAAQEHLVNESPTDKHGRDQLASSRKVFNNF